MKFTLLLILTFTVSFSSLAQSEAIRKKHFNIKKKVAIKGYDPVSYFSGDPQEGSKSIWHTYKGVTYYFKDVSNQQKFKKDPAKYEPQYGGWCAYAIGETGDKVKINPERFQILDGKLYLFYDFGGFNTLESWKKDQTNLKHKADKNWEKLVQ
ncbi:MAG: YHS domain-containing (seleno)protein [Bacteroidota bacterium]